jgi:adenine deaminase
MDHPMRHARSNVVLVLGLVGWSAAAEVPGPVVLRNCSIFDVAKGEMLPGRTVVLAGGKIQAIGTRGASVAVPPGTLSIEATGKFLIPGLIDAHVHVVQILASAHITGDEILPLFLAAGVTSVRDTGDEVVPETLVARFAANHPESCPRVFTCSPLIDKDPPFHNYESPAMVFGKALTDPAKVPEFVDDMAAWGVTSLKIYQELEMLVESGLTPAAAIGCATLNNAKAIGQQDQLGTIETGKVADLILLNANPIDRIANTRAIATVFHGGIAVDPAKILKLVPKE